MRKNPARNPAAPGGILLLLTSVLRIPGSLQKARTLQRIGTLATMGLLGAGASNTARGETYNYIGTGTSNNWTAASTWTNGSRAFPNAAGDIVRPRSHTTADVNLYLNTNITIGTLEWSGSAVYLYPGVPAGKLTNDHLGAPSTWRIVASNQFQLNPDLILKDSLTLSILNATGFEFWRIDAVRLGGLVSGPGKLTLDTPVPVLNTYAIGAEGGGPNTHSGGTMLLGHPSGGTIYEPRKYKAFGTGDVEVGPGARLYLRKRGTTDDYIANTAALWLETLMATNRANVHLESGVNESVARLYLDGVQQPAGVYGATGSPAAEPLDEFLTGPGLLTVTSGPPPPGSLRNLPAGDVLIPEATLRGEVLTTNAAPTLVYIYWGPTDGGRDFTAWAFRIPVGAAGIGEFSYPINAGSAGETIYYRCYLTNALGGSWASSTARLCPPLLRNELPVVRTNVVTLRGALLTTNGLPTSVAVYWGTSDGGTVPANWNNSIALGVATSGWFATNLFGLPRNTSYYYRFYGTNDSGEGWAGSSQAFTTVGPPAYGEIVFLVGSDSHFGYTYHVPTCTERMILTLDNMNLIPGLKFPASAGGSPLGMPRGLLAAGDLTESSSLAQWMTFTNEMGLNGERRLAFPVFEGYGNHDGVAVCEGIKARNPLRTGGRNLSLSTNGYHYSWDWDFLHVVCLNVFPGDEADPGYLINDPYKSLQFAISDLATNVGTSGRPVVLYHHYGFDTNSGLISWSSRQRTNYYNALKNYNVIGIFAGHSHLREYVNWQGINTFVDGTMGKHTGNFLTVRVTRTNLVVVERTPDNTWGYVFKTNITVPPPLLVSNGEGATEVAFSSARLNGQFLMDAPPPVGFNIFWGPTDGGTNAAAWANAASFDSPRFGSYSVAVNDLSPGATYYYRCRATNATGAGWAAASASFRTRAVFTEWAASMRVTFGGYAGTTTLTNFPALVAFHTNRPGFSYEQFSFASASDLRFADNDGAELHFEIDTWDTNGNSYVWVQVPRLTGTNTAIRAYWNNPALADAPPAYTTNGATWSEGYAGVWHLGQTNALNSVDGAKGTATGNTNQAGLFGGAQSFSRAMGHQSISVGDLDVTNFTLEAWTSTAYNGTFGARRVMEKSGAFVWEQSALGSNLNLTVTGSAATNRYSQGGCFDLGAAAWTHQAITYSSSQAEARGYINATLRYVKTNAGGLVPNQNNSPLTLSSPGAGYYGRLDEVRLSRVVRSADWLAAGYASATNHAAFTSYDRVKLRLPPVLSPVADQRVELGATLLVTNHAFSPGSPDEPLNFSLLAAPPRASLHVNSNHGILRWQPSLAEYDTTNLVTLQVSDHNLPPLSAIQNFKVTAIRPSRPVLFGQVQPNGHWDLEVAGPIGSGYTLEYSTNLADWTTLGTTSLLGLKFSWTDTNASFVQKRFYRIRR